MSHIQQFLSQHWPQYYLEVLKNHVAKDQLLDLTNQFNIFDLTFDILLLAKYDPKTHDTTWIEKLMHRHLWIEYESLKNVQLVKCDSDSEIVSLMKSQVKYVLNQMVQILLRLMQCYLVCCQCQYLNNTILKNISQISYIYPALKIELINYPDINLPDWFDKYLNIMIHLKGNRNNVFHLFLQKLKQQCLFSIPMEKVINKLIGTSKAQTSNILKTVHIQVSTKKLQVSSNDSQNQSQKIIQDDTNNQKFSDLQMFRRKKRIFKVASQINNATPIQQKKLSKNTPKTEQTLQLKKFNNSKSPSKRIPIFKKIKKQKRPLQRTLYYGETKKFMPKNNLSSDLFMENTTSSSTLLHDQNIFFDFNKKIQRDLSKRDTLAQNQKGFFVPETPRPDLAKKARLDKKTYSMDSIANYTNSQLRERF